MGAERRPISQPQQPFATWRRLTSARWSSSQRRTSGANAILLRRTDRLPFAPPPEWDSFESHVRRSVDSEFVRLDVIGDDQRARLAEASQLTESLRLYDSSYHAELHWWTAAFDIREGIPYGSLVSAAESDRVDVGRSFPVTHTASVARRSARTIPRSWCYRLMMIHTKVCWNAAKGFRLSCSTPQWSGRPAEQ